MKLSYTTEKPPLNFIFLGLFLLVTGVWRVLVADWFGIILLMISLLCLFIRWGVTVDIDNSRIKKYTGFMGLRFGKWKDISKTEHIEINTIQETQGMSVASISRSDSSILYQLFLVLPDESIELMRGEKDLIDKVAEKISEALKIKIVDE